MRTFIDAAYWLTLTIWIGVLVAAGVSATATFTILPDLDLTVGGFEAVAATEHGRIAAGHVMESIFTFVDIVQVVAVVLVILLVVAQWFTHPKQRRSTANVVRIIALVAAVGLFAGRAAMLTPSMNADLRAYWESARAGDVETAMTHQTAFDEAHPTASRLFSATLLSLVLALLASPAALAPRRRPGLLPPTLLEIR